MFFAEPYHLSDSEGYLQVDCGDFRLKGRSIAGVETVLSFPELNVTFDTGRAPAFACGQDWLALTHCHTDHAGALAFYLGTRCLNNLNPLKITVPEIKKEQLKNYLEAFLKLAESRLTYEIIGNASVHKIKKDLELRAIPAFHCVAACGYIVDRIKRKLKIHFQGVAPEVIMKAKAHGETVDEERLEPWLAVSGDTTGEFLDGEASSAKVLLMECTYFSDDVDFAKIRHYGHTHIKDWKARAEKIKSPIVVMTHTSRRYSRAEIEKYCLKNLPKELLDRLIVFR